MEAFTLKSRYYFIRLPADEQKIYRQIYDAWHEGGTKAELILPGQDFSLPSGKELHDIVKFIIHDNPHLFHLETSQFLYSRLGSRVTIEAENVYTPQEYKRIYQKLNKRVDEILEKARKYPTDMDRLRFLHDYLVENTTYDYGLPDPRSQREIHTIVGALLKHACVCDGYSRAFRLLCDRLHLSCIVITGDGFPDGKMEPHAWNVVKIGGKVYHCDVTWDSNMFAAGYPLYDHYFLRGDAFFRKDHRWDGNYFPPIPADAPRAYTVLKNKEELEKLICDQVRAGRKEVIAPLDDSFPGGKVLEQLVDKIVKRNLAFFLLKGVTGYTLEYMDTIKTAKITFQ